MRLVLMSDFLIFMLFLRMWLDSLDLWFMSYFSLSVCVFYIYIFYTDSVSHHEWDFSGEWECCILILNIGLDCMLDPGQSWHLFAFGTSVFVFPWSAAASAFATVTETSSCSPPCSQWCIFFVPVVLWTVHVHLRWPGRGSVSYSHSHPHTSGKPV